LPRKDDPETGQVVLSVDGEWKPFSEAMGYEIMDAEIKPFKKNEKLLGWFGDRGRMGEVDRYEKKNKATCEPVSF
jgi:hypothetical protein